MKKYLLLSFLLSVFFAKAQHAFFRGTNNYVAPLSAAPTRSNGLDFDGINDYVSVNSASGLNITSNISLSAWVFRNSSGKYDCIIGKDNYASNNGYSLWIYNDDKLTLRFGNSRIYKSIASIPSGVWVHLAGTFDGTNARLYINGTLDSSYPASSPSSNNGLLYLGTPQDAIGNVSYNFSGVLDDIRIWNITLSQSDIQTSMNSELAGTETGLVAYYPFNQGIAAGNNTAINNVIDKTPNALNGVLNNFARTGTTSNFVVGKVVNVITVPRVISNGLQLHYDASNPTSYPGTGSTWYDLSGNNRNGTLVNNSGFNSSVAGGVLTFNGTNQYINTTYIPSPTCTISIWFYNNLNYSDWNRGIFSTFALGNYNGFYMGTSSVGSFNPSLNIWYNGNSALYSISSVMTINRWYNITVTSGSGTISIYLNGVLKNTISGSTNHADVLNIGRTRFDNNYWSGYIGNTMVYDRVLSAAEVTQNFDTLKTNFGL
jgi:hypothetical protein